MTRVVFNEQELARLLTGPQGPVARDLARRAVNVQSQAKINATGRPGPNVQSGRLRGSITHELATDEKGLVARIGTNVEYAAYVELGTPPHKIRALGRGNGGKQALFWKGARHPVRSVNHPGTIQRPYLRPALPAAKL